MKYGTWCLNHINPEDYMEEDTESTITITFGDQGENEVGMQKIGSMADRGFLLDDLEYAVWAFESVGVECELVDLRDYAPEEIRSELDESAAILIVRDGVNKIFEWEELDKEGYTADSMFEEQTTLEWDTKTYSSRFKKVTNKHARHNLCFADFSQESDFDNGKGTVVNFEDVPITDMLRKQLEGYLCEDGTLSSGDIWQPLIGEGNYYYDYQACYIGAHGDKERRRVIAVRLGRTMNLKYRWYRPSLPDDEKKADRSIGEEATFHLSHGDIYIMGEKAVGTDWMKRNIYTLRHRAGYKFEDET